MSHSANEPKVEILKDIPRKEEFQKYLEKAGVIDQLTKLLVSLYENPDRPENALDYIRTFLGSKSNAPIASDDAATKELQQRIADLEKELQEKNAEINALKQLSQEEENIPEANEASNDNQD
mmetsp:Transcript_9233/g.14980  ORF Transcript_9233/g.14980 Transcript_9233/m.14980 type:complete len:122 (-) Transcript_9233:94-459(-)